MMNPPLSSVLAEFLLACQADGLSKSTIEWYTSLLTAFVETFAGTLVKDISPHDVRQYLSRLRQHYTSPDTISDHIRALHRFWKWTAGEYAIANPMRQIKYPRKTEPRPKAADMNDLIAMFEVAGDGAVGARNQAILAFLLDTGCRAAGVVGLKVSDVDMKARRALVTEKGDKTRYVTFTSFTAELLIEWMAVRQREASALFYNFDTLQPLTRNGLYQMLRRLARRGGVKGRFNPHSLRHTFAREYIKNGGDLATLARLLGHRDVSTTVSHYAIFTDPEIAEKHNRYSPVNRLKEAKDETTGLARRGAARACANEGDAAGDAGDSANSTDHGADGD